MNYATKRQNRTLVSIRDVLRTQSTRERTNAQQSRRIMKRPSKIEIQIFAVDLDFDSYKVGSLKRSSCVGECLGKSLNKLLRYFLSIALCIPTAHDFRVISASTWARARAERKRFPSN